MNALTTLKGYIAETLEVSITGNQNCLGCRFNSTFHFANHYDSLDRLVARINSGKLKEVESHKKAYQVLETIHTLVCKVAEEVGLEKTLSLEYVSDNLITDSDDGWMNLNTMEETFRKMQRIDEAKKRLKELTEAVAKEFGVDVSDLS